MFLFSRPAVVATLLLLTLRPILGDESKAAVDLGLAAADKLYRAGKFADAEACYIALLKTDSKLVAAQVGLIRAMLGEQKIDEALDTVNTALAAEPNSEALLAARGDVQFRRGEMQDSEKSYLAAQKLARAQLGLARLYLSYSMYRRAFDLLEIAHRNAPDDVEVQAMWLAMLPRKERLTAMESFLARAHPDQEEEISSMAKYFEYLKTRAGESVHGCRLLSKVDETEMKLKVFTTDLRGYAKSVALPASVNDHNIFLQVDTGASGIMVSSAFAKAAGLTRLSTAYVGGIGDQGLLSGYRALADRIQIGDLEFQDCVVLVADRLGLGGLIGTDVFGSYLVDLDIPEMRLKLSPLPKRPEDSAAPTSLNSDSDDPSSLAQEEENVPKQTAIDNPSAPIPKSTNRLPRDRYVAPEMINWTQVFRFGHMILVPTAVNESKPMLFLIDTGGPSNALSVRAGRQIGKVRSEDGVRLQGMSGKVDKVYSSAKADLRFGHFEQKNKDIITFDFSAVNRRIGTEISGMLGYDTLRLLEVKLDYRDGLVDFENPKQEKR
jgi:tetratricopeptide (TPR) repeat protein